MFYHHFDSAQVKSALDRTYGLAKDGYTIAATDCIVGAVDRWIYDGKFTQVSLLLQEVDTFRLPPEALTGVLCVTLPVRQRLSKSRADFFERSMVALTEVWGWSQDRIQAVTLRLGKGSDGLL